MQSAPKLQKYLKKGDNINVVINTTHSIVLPKWYCKLFPFINGLLELDEKTTTVNITLDEQLEKFIPELFLWMVEVLTTRKFSVKYTPVHFETLTMINFLGFEKPLNIRLFNILKLQKATIPAILCTLDEYLKLLPDGFLITTAATNKHYQITINDLADAKKFREVFLLKQTPTNFSGQTFAVIILRPLRVIKDKISDVYISKQLYELCDTEKSTWRSELFNRLLA